MGKIIYFTGGARSGKSGKAQAFAQRYADVGYIATMYNLDEESALRIEKHKAERPQTWQTYECPTQMAGVAAAGGHEVFLVDCMTVYATNLIFRQKADWDTETAVLSKKEAVEIESSVMKNIEAVLLAMQNSTSDFIVVSNEVGLGLVPETPLGRLFRDISGRMNQMIAAQASEAYFVVSGIEIPLKGAL